MPPQLDADAPETDPELARLRAERGYSYSDVVAVSPSTLPNYEARAKAFFEEHIHTDEEIRFCLAGSGYFDVRDAEDRWIRVHVRKGDLIVLPEGIYHRFTLDESGAMTAMRLFIGAPVWTPHNRPACASLESRRRYEVRFLGKPAESAVTGASGDAKTDVGEGGDRDRAVGGAEGGGREAGLVA